MFSTVTSLYSVAVVSSENVAGSALFCGYVSSASPRRLCIHQRQLVSYSLLAALRYNDSTDFHKDQR